jgi:hypothetical protein
VFVTHSRTRVPHTLHTCVHTAAARAWEPHTASARAPADAQRKQRRASSSWAQPVLAVVGHFLARCSGLFAVKELFEHAHGLGARPRRPRSAPAATFGKATLRSSSARAPQRLACGPAQEARCGPGPCRCAQTNGRSGTRTRARDNMTGQLMRYAGVRVLPAVLHPTLRATSRRVRIRAEHGAAAARLVASCCVPVLRSLHVSVPTCASAPLPACGCLSGAQPTAHSGRVRSCMQAPPYQRPPPVPARTIYQRVAHVRPAQPPAPARLRHCRSPPSRRRRREGFVEIVVFPTARQFRF